jgi:hypothetical protein
VLVASADLGAAGRAGVLAAVLLVLAGILAFFALQRGGRLATLLTNLRLVRWLGGRAVAERLARGGREVDRRLAHFHAERRPAFLASFGLHLAGTALGAVQLAVFLRLLGPPHDLATVLSIFLIGVASDLVAFFVPARLGAQEGSRMLATSLAGVGAELGLLFSLALRAEQLFWAGTGFAFYLALAPRARRVAAADYGSRPARRGRTCLLGSRRPAAAGGEWARLRAGP